LYLMDSIAQVATAAPAGDPILDIYADLRDRMTGAPRFLLDNAAIHASVEIGLGRPKVLLEALEHVQVPYPVMWVEWAEAGREKLRTLVGAVDPVPGRPIPDRLGFLLECDKGGRKGVATWAWTSPGNDVPNIAPISPFFDLDASIKQPPDRRTGILTGNLGQMWRDNPVQLEALYAIWRTAKHQPSKWGLKYFSMLATKVGNIEERIDHNFADVYGEYIEIWTIILLLTSSRQAVEYRQMDRAKINKARTKRRETPLLDHTEVVMHLSNRVAKEAPHAPLGYARKSPRIHMVSRYLARRGDKHWLVEPYMRGSGSPVPRHVQVRG
jgi:hypothetical protein